MGPSWARKGSKRWPYYVSQAALQGDKSKAGSITRVPAANVEAFVAEAVRKLFSDGSAASQADIRNLIDRITIGRTKIQVQLAEAAEVCGGREDADVTVDAAVALSEAGDHSRRR